MSQNRTLPYGYQIESGRIMTNDVEAGVIRRIYRAYAERLSYKAIAERLTAEGIRYMPEKPEWNKNMVARILQNSNYLGTGKYPPIIEETLGQAATLAQKPYSHTESQDIKDIKPLLVCAVCGSTLKRRLKRGRAERWYCEADPKHIGMEVNDEILLKSTEGLWRRLMENIGLADAGASAGGNNQISLETIRLKNEIDQMLGEKEINENEIQAKILELAALRYSFCETPQHTNRDLMRRLSQEAQGFNAKLILETTAEIKVSYCEAEALVLKNGKVIEKGANRHGHRGS